MTSWLTGLEGLAYPQVVSPPYVYVKDPYEIRDFDINWLADWPGNLPENDPIVSSTWAVDGEMEIVQASFTDTTTTVRLSGGLVGWEYHAVNRVATAGGLRSERTLHIRVKQL